VVFLASQGNILTSQPLYHLRFTILDASSVSYDVIQNGRVIAQSGNLAFDSNITLDEGINNFEIKAVDAAGNIALPAFISDIELDTMPPVLNLKPDNNTVINSLALAVSGSSNEKLQSITVNGMNLTLASNKKDFSDSIGLGTEGDHVITFTGYDLAGNISQVTRNIKVVLAVFNKNLIAIEPTSNGAQLLIKGAPSAVRAGLEVPKQLQQMRMEVLVLFLIHFQT
jgi:hypothetical protein